MVASEDELEGAADTAGGGVVEREQERSPRTATATSPPCSDLFIL